MVSRDIYINETTRHAHIILPPAPCLTEEHADLFFANMAVGDGMHWSAPVLQSTPQQRRDGQILLEPAERLGGGITGIRPLDAMLRALGVRLTPAHLADVALRLGPYGDHLLLWSKGLSRRKLLAAPHGVDLGALRPGFRRRVHHSGRRIWLDAPVLMQAFDTLEQDLSRDPSHQLSLIGRRSLNSNNSWLHNVPRLVAGKDRCILSVHPADADRVDVADGGQAVLVSSLYRGKVTVHITDEVRRGVVSLPHGYSSPRLGGAGGPLPADRRTSVPGLDPRVAR